MTYSRKRGRSSTPRMPPTVPATAPTAPPTTAPTGPASRPPCRAPSCAPRTVPCACAAIGNASVAANIIDTKSLVFMVAPFGWVIPTRWAGPRCKVNPRRRLRFHRAGDKSSDYRRNRRFGVRRDGAVADGTKSSAETWLSQTPRSEDYPMLAFEIIGVIFVLLFLAAAMTGIEGSHGH